MYRDYMPSILVNQDAEKVCTKEHSKQITADIQDKDELLYINKNSINFYPQCTPASLYSETCIRRKFAQCEQIL
jgi:hypothetical protein